jgi:HD-GYP domain-containing protein (c-di-GMP phosphodiesterase class II)
MSEHRKVIAIGDLRVGMFVTKLDIAWLDSPFLSHTRSIKEDADIAALLHAGVKTLTIDTSRGVDVAPAPDLEPREDAHQETLAAVTLKTQEDRPQPAAALERELQVAVDLRSKIKKAVENLAQTLEAGAPVDVTELAPLVESTLDSLERNDQALMSLVHLSRKAHRLADHVFGTFCLVLNLALSRKVPEQEREHLGLAALLHEAGWTQLPLNLIGKHSPYTAAELALVQKHTLIGQQMLAQSDLPELTRRIIAEHHERLDGSGYPAALRSDQIHPLSQLFAVVDAYDERVHQLTDELGMIPTAALRSLYQDAENGVFPPDVVAALIHRLGIYPSTTAVQLKSGERAVVREHHPDAPLQPVVEIHYDAKGTALAAPLVVDLRQVAEARRAIESALDASAIEDEHWRWLRPSGEQLINGR